MHYLSLRSQTAEVFAPRITALQQRICDAFPDESHEVRRQLSAIQVEDKLLLPPLRVIATMVMAENGSLAAEIQALVQEVSESVRQEVKGNGGRMQDPQREQRLDAARDILLRIDIYMRSEGPLSQAEIDGVLSDISGSDANSFVVFQAVHMFCRRGELLSPEQKRMLGVAVERRAQDMDGKSISLILNSLSWLQIRTGFNALLGAAEKKPELLSGRDAATVCAALARSKARVLPAWLLQRSEKTVNTMNGTDLCQIFRAFVEFKLRDFPPVFIQRLEVVLPEMLRMDVVNITKALADMGFSKCPASLVERLKKVAPLMTARDVATSLASLAKLRVRMPLAELTERAVAVAHKMNPLDVSDTIRVFRELGQRTCPPQLLQRAQELQANMRPRDVARTLRGLSKLQEPCPFDILDTAVHLVSAMNDRDIDAVLRALEKFGVTELPPPIFRRLCSRDVLTGRRVQLMDGLFERLGTFQNIRALIDEAMQQNGNSMVSGFLRELQANLA